jgi:hypothetical protein
MQREIIVNLGSAFGAFWNAINDELKNRYPYYAFEIEDTRIFVLDLPPSQVDLIRNYAAGFYNGMNYAYENPSTRLPV